MKKKKIKSPKKKEPVVLKTSKPKPKEVDSPKSKIERLREQLRLSIEKFSKNHVFYLSCFPNGRRAVNKDGVDKSVQFQQHLYICGSSCEKKCRAFEKKIYLCRDLTCSNWPVCMYLSEEKMVNQCKKANLYKERKELDKRYRNFLLNYRIFRGLKLDPKKTIEFLRKRAEKKKLREETDGKVSARKNEEDRKREGLKKRAADKESLRKKDSLKSRKVRRRKGY